MNDYFNTVEAIDGRNTEAIQIAADRLMPPQFCEFIRSISGGDVSNATREYWENVYNMFVEITQEG